MQLILTYERASIGAFLEKGSGLGRRGSFQPGREGLSIRSLHRKRISMCFSFNYRCSDVPLGTPNCSSSADFPPEISKGRDCSSHIERL